VPASSAGGGTGAAGSRGKAGRRAPAGGSALPSGGGARGSSSEPHGFPSSCATTGTSPPRMLPAAALPLEYVKPSLAVAGAAEILICAWGECLIDELPAGRRAALRCDWVGRRQHEIRERNLPTDSPETAH
jgi:hypothetical protein